MEAGHETMPQVPQCAAGPEKKTGLEGIQFQAGNKSQAGSQKVGDRLRRIDMPQDHIAGLRRQPVLS